MPERRGSRFAAEVLFLVALAVSLTLARLEAIEIAGAMLLGWVIVAAFEWTAWRREPHYGGGLPPRYHVPLVQLPPPQPLEQVERGYPAGSRDDAPTWIASAAVRAELLGEWPRASLADVVEEEEEQEVVFASPSQRDADPWTIAALPTAPDTDGEPAPSLQLPQRRLSSGARMARYTFDPLADPPPRRRFGRGGASRDSIDVEARPLARLLPGEAR